MAQALDTILVIDIEATCWRDTPPIGQENEIIEIGIASLDVASLLITDKESILVKPDHSRVSRFCTQLTGLTQDLLDRKGISFTEACSRLQQSYASRSRSWASYGDFDRSIFQRQCQASLIEYPFGSTHLNVKNLFAVTHGLPREVDLPGALRMLGLQLEGRHHSGSDDAYNAAKILVELLRHGRERNVP